VRGKDFIAMDFQIQIYEQKRLLQIQVTTLASTKSEGGQPNGIDRGFHCFSFGFFVRS
jgi:hypothetical protein